MTSIDFSVIIPLYNASPTIERSIQSALNQTYQPKEIIVVDDKSTDNSLSVVQSIKTHDIKVVLIQNTRNLGVSRARNIAIEKASSNWIAFLDADDFWHPQKLEIQKYFIEKTGAKLIGCTSTLKEMDSRIKVNQLKTQTLYPRHFLWKNFFPTPGIVTEKSNILTFNENLRFSEDFDLWRKLVQKYNQAILIKYPLVVLSKHPFLDSGLSSNLIRMEIGELKALSQENNIYLRYLAYIFSLLKFIKRVLLKFLRTLVIF